MLTASKVVEHSIQQKQKTYKSDDFINDKLILKNISKDKAISTKNSTDLKAELTKKFRSINTLIDERTQELEQENPDSFLTRIKEDISKMDNFSEEEQVRNVMYKIPKGALDRYSNQVQFKLKSSFDSTLFEIKRSLDEINEIVFSSFKELVKKQPLLLSKSLPSELTQEVLNQHIQYSRSYEKSITKKGIQNLLMEIRTPLFMLMPLMMFFGLFGAIFQENDEGEILNDKTTHNGKNAVVITKLPSKYTSPELFITKLYSGSIKTKFTKSEAGKSKLQLGQIEKKILLPYGTKSKIEYRPDYSKESGNLIVYLPADADRDFVINALLNPANGLLVIPGRAGGPGGYSAIPKFLNKLGNKRYLLVGGLFVLLIWFIIKKQREFKTEKMEIRDREKKNMKQNLRQDMERMVRGSTSKWKSRVSDYVNERQANLQLMIDDKLSKVIENNKEMVQESNSLLSRRKKNTEVQLKNLKSNTEKLKKTKKEIIFMKSNFRKIEGFIE